MQERDNALSLLIEKSIDLKSKVNSIDEKAQNQYKNQKSGRKATNIGDLIQDLEMQVNSMMSSNGNGTLQECNDQNVIEVRNHLIDLYQRIAINFLKKHQYFIEKIQKTDGEWQETCD